MNNEYNKILDNIPVIAQKPELNKKYNTNQIKLEDILKINNSSNIYSDYVIEDLVKNILHILDFNKTKPIPIVRIANAFAIDVFEVKNMPDEMLGNLFIGGNTKKFYNNDQVIVVDNNISLSYQRFIIAFEIGIYLLNYFKHKNNSKKDKAFSNPYLLEQSIMQNLWAYNLAKELLAPMKIFKYEYVKIMKNSNYDKLYSIFYCAEIFKITEDLVITRINDIFT